MKQSANGKVQISVQCHPKVISDVRKYAKERSQEEQQRIINQQKIEKL